MGLFDSINQWATALLYYSYFLRVGPEFDACGGKKRQKEENALHVLLLSTREA